MKLNEVTPDQAKDTGLAFVLILLLVIVLANYSFLLWPAVAVLVLTMTWPDAFKPLAVVWFGFSHLLGGFVSKILLSILFFVLVVPIGYARKRAGKDAMRIKNWKDGTDSAFTTRDHLFVKDDLEKPY